MDCGRLGREKDGRFVVHPYYEKHVETSFGVAIVVLLTRSCRKKCYHENPNPYKSKLYGGVTLAEANNSRNIYLIALKGVIALVCLPTEKVTDTATSTTTLHPITGEFSELYLQAIKILNSKHFTK